MIVENLSTLKIHKLTKEQYERELEAGNLDETALYLTPDEIATTDIEHGGTGATTVEDARTNLGVYSQIETDEKIETAISSSAIAIPETAEVGQTIVVKSIDNNGKPTEWETSYLNGLWHIKTITLTEEVTSITVDTDEDGNPFNVQKLIFKFTAIGGTGNTNYAYYHFYPNPINAGAIRCDVEDGVYPAGRTIGSTGEIQMLGAATYFIRFCPSNKNARQLAATQAGGKYTSIQSLTVYLSTEGYTFGVGTKLEVYGVSV